MKNYKHRIIGIFLILFIFLVSMSCNYRGHGTYKQNVRTGNKDVNLESQKKYNLLKLAFDDVLTNTNIFSDLYSLHSKKCFSIYDKKIELELYNVKKEEWIYYDNIPKSIIIVKSDNNEIKLPIKKYRPLDEILYIVPKTDMPILCISNPSGGNGWNVNPFYVISLEDKYFLKNIGEVSDAYDVDVDAIDELIKVDNTWELGLGYLCHADAPGVIIILRVEKDKIISDVSNNINYYRGEIIRINIAINKFPKEIPREGNQRLFSLILQKFLIYRLLKNIDEGWREFNKDIRHYDDKFFYLYDGQRKQGLDKIPIDEIKNKMNES